MTPPPLQMAQPRDDERSEKADRPPATHSMGGNTKKSKQLVRVDPKREAINELLTSDGGGTAEAYRPWGIAPSGTCLDPSLRLETHGFGARKGRRKTVSLV